jgi:hypothetical protein
MRIGYAPFSTDDQTLDLQRGARERAKCPRIYEEHASGKTTLRPELDACLKSLRKGDTLVVWRLDRLGRSLGDLIHLTTELRSRRVNFESVTEKLRLARRQESSSFIVFALLAELLHLSAILFVNARWPTSELLAPATGIGVGPGNLRPKISRPFEALMHAGELPVQDIADRFGVSRSTLYRNEGASRVA